MHCASLRDGRWPLFSRKGDGVALEATKTSFLPPKKSYTKVLGFFRPKKRNPSKKMKNIWISKKRPLGCFFQPLPFKKWSIMIHLSKKSQKRILPKCRLRFPAAHDLESWFSVVGLRFSRKIVAPMAMSVTSHRAEAKQFTLLLVKTVCYAFGFIGFRSFSPKFCTKKWWSQRDVLTFVGVLSWRKRLQSCKDGTERFICRRTILYLGLGDIFNMGESFEWKFQSCFKSSEMLKMNLRLLTVLKVNETVPKCSHLLARVFYDLTRDMILLCCPFAGST